VHLLKNADTTALGLYDLAALSEADAAAGGAVAVALVARDEEQNREVARADEEDVDAVELLRGQNIAEGKKDNDSNDVEAGEVREDRVRLDALQSAHNVLEEVLLLGVRVDTRVLLRDHGHHHGDEEGLAESRVDEKNGNSVLRVVALAGGPAGRAKLLVSIKLVMSPYPDLSQKLEGLPHGRRRQRAVLVGAAKHPKTEADTAESDKGEQHEVDVGSDHATELMSAFKLHC